MVQYSEHRSACKKAVDTAEDAEVHDLTAYGVSHFETGNFLLPQYKDKLVLEGRFS